MIRSLVALAVAHRLLVLSALSIALLTMLGAAGESLGYDRWLKANTVKRRTHSLFRQGRMMEPCHGNQLGLCEALSVKLYALDLMKRLSSEVAFTTA